MSSYTIPSPISNASSSPYTSRSTNSNINTTTSSRRQFKSSRPVSSCSISNPNIINRSTSTRTQHISKSQSVSSIQHPAINRLNPSSSPISTVPISSDPKYPLPRSSSAHSTMSSSPRYGESSSRPVSIRRSQSTRSRIHSPSPSILPSTERMSYFPPFESMGSNDENSPEQNNSESGPSSPKRSHSKGRSLTSLAGIMSPLWSMALSTSPAKHFTMNENQNTTSPRYQTRSRNDTAPTADELVEALSKRCQSRRRILEPLTTSVLNENEQVKRGAVMMDTVERKRRMRSEYEIEGILAGSKVDQASGPPSEDEEGAVERMVTMTRSSTRRSKPNLTVPLPPLPTWRFPMPSPPVTCLSPDIPNQAFRPIENPITSGSSSLSCSPIKEKESKLAEWVSRGSYNRQNERDEIDAVEEGLVSIGPTDQNSRITDCASALRPTTPPRKRVQAEQQVQLSRKLKKSPPSSRNRETNQEGMSDLEEFLSSSLAVMMNGKGQYLQPQLERTVSQLSSDSKETIRPDLIKGGEGEVTPKASTILSRG